MQTLEPKTTKKKEEVEKRTLKGALIQFQAHLDRLHGEADRSYDLLDEYGEKTELVKDLEALMSDPLNSLYHQAVGIEKNLRSLIDIFVRTFLQQHSSLLLFAGRTKTYNDDLHYTLALTEDNVESRDKIFDFFEVYNSLDVSKKCPVYFRFVPSHLIKKLSISEELSFEKK